MVSRQKRNALRRRILKPQFVKKAKWDLLPLLAQLQHLHWLFFEQHYVLDPLTVKLRSHKVAVRSSHELSCAMISKCPNIARLHRMSQACGQCAFAASAFVDRGVDCRCGVDSIMFIADSVSILVKRSYEH